MYDYVIAGGGTAGCVMAARLSEMADAKVLLIEAGPRDRDPYIHMPVGFFKMTSGPLVWGFETAPARHFGALFPEVRVGRSSLPIRQGSGTALSVRLRPRGVGGAMTSLRRTSGAGFHPGGAALPSSGRGRR